jgi:hypothetical protein
MAERRSPVMIVVDAWWEGADGSLQQGQARIVNRSVSGACVRIEKQIPAGAKLRIESRWEEFCGVAKYCRKDGSGYRVGIQRKAGVDLIPKQAAKSLLNRDDRQREETNFEEPHAPGGEDRQRHEPTPVRPVLGAVAKREEPVLLENLADDPVAGGQLTGQRRMQSIPVAETEAGATQNEGIVKAAAEEPAPGVGDSEWSRKRAHSSQDRGVWWEALAALLLKEDEAQKEGGSRLMGINWMGRAKRGAEDARQNGNASSGGAGEKNKAAEAAGDARERDKAAAPARAAQPIQERGAAAVDGDLTYQSELLPLEEIYMAAGIVSPRRGYNIKKVVEMLHSEHLGGLSKEMRRASVLMALDAAGISVHEVLRDAEVRLETIKSYEESQKQLWEAEWDRKTEEHGQLKAELELIRARMMERMKQILDGIARDRARFGTWLTTMHEEAQSIAEAAELCIKVDPAMPAPAPNNVAVVPKASEGKETMVKVV